MQRREFLAGAAGALLSAGAAPVLAQAWPERPIKAIQGFAAGGNADTIARLVGAEMQKGLGQPIVVEAVTGAGGTLASAAVASAAPQRIPAAFWLPFDAAGVSWVNLPPVVILPSTVPGSSLPAPEARVTVSRV